MNTQNLNILLTSKWEEQDGNPQNIKIFMLQGISLYYVPLHWWGIVF